MRAAEAVPTVVQNGHGPKVASAPDASPTCQFGNDVEHWRATLLPDLDTAFMPPFFDPFAGRSATSGPTSEIAGGPANQPAGPVMAVGGFGGDPQSGSFDGGSPSAAASYQAYQRQRQLTLGDLLLENRIVFLQGEIHYGNANELVMKLLYLQSENRRKDIHFYINSPGGSVTATLAIYDTMQMLSCPVATYCVGEACSGGAVLLVGGHQGKRYCLPNSRVMIHQPLGGVGGQVSDIEIQANEMFRYRDVLNDIISKHTGKSVEQIAKDTERDFFLSAQQAVEYGCVDGILEKPPTEDDDD